VRAIKNFMGDANNSGEEEAKDKTGADENAEGAEGADDTQADKGKNDGGAEDKGASGDEKKDGGEGDGDGADADDKGGGEDKGEGDKKPKPADKKPTQDADAEPPKRKRNVDFIIERKAQKIAKSKDKGNGADKGKDEEEDADADNDEEDVAPEDAKIIDKRIAKALKPFADKQVQEQDKAEVDAFVSANPDFKPYADKVLKWAQHPSRQGIPIESIFYEVAGKDLMKIGAERGKKADEEAKKTNAGGGNNRGGNNGGTKPVWEMSKDEFEAEQAKTRNKQPE
jgi:hypothetical protein